MPHFPKPAQYLSPGLPTLSKACIETVFLSASWLRHTGSAGLLGLWAGALFTWSPSSFLGAKACNTGSSAHVGPITNLFKKTERHLGGSLCSCQWCPGEHPCTCFLEHMSWRFSRVGAWRGNYQATGSTYFFISYLCFSTIPGNFHHSNNPDPISTGRILKDRNMGWRLLFSGRMYTHFKGSQMGCWVPDHALKRH